MGEFCKVERGKFTHRPRDDPNIWRQISVHTDWRCS